jgi:5-methyltetrahydrofolate--homocysteine methyltransferase
MKFIAIGENIHCTRIYKVGGAFVKQEGDSFFIFFDYNGKKNKLPVPEAFTQRADWKDGKVRHCAVAAYQALYGAGEAKEFGSLYIKSMAIKQEKSKASFLDINVDEFSTDVQEKIKVIKWMAKVVQEASSLPLSIDSSNSDILRAGLEACEAKKGKAMVNSVSLERKDAIKIAAQFGAVVIASAAGEKDMPSGVDDRLGNILKLYELLKQARIPDESIFFDPLVFPVATDPENGIKFLEAVHRIKEKFGSKVHISGGLSNVSFGLPNRRLINQVFTYLAMEAGCDSGIVDPIQINEDILAALDTKSEPFNLAKALLTGEDAFGAEYIAAHRAGRLGKE